MHNPMTIMDCLEIKNLKRFYKMQKVIKSIAICFLLAVIFVIGCGEDSTLPTKVKKDGGESIGLAVSHTEALNGEDFSVAIAQELAEQGVKLSETSTITALPSSSI